MCRIVAYADGATDPIDFPIAPKFALDKLLAQVPDLYIAAYYSLLR